MGWLNTLNEKLVGLAVGAIGILVVMWRDISLLKQKVDSDREKHRTEMDEVKRNVDSQAAAIKALETRMGAQDVVLGRIDENIKTIMSSLNAAG